jgi:hypothetical protein
MRPKFIAFMLGLGAICLAALMLLRQRSAVSPETQTADADALATSQSAQAQPQEITEIAVRAEEAQPAPPSTPVSVAAGTGGDNSSETAEDECRDAVEARVAELENLFGQQDSASLETFFSEIRNPEPEIRRAALDGITQSGVRDLIPRLNEVAAQTDDPKQKRAITDAIDFLQLPTLTELLRQQAETGNNGNPTAGAEEPNRGQPAPGTVAPR